MIGAIIGDIVDSRFEFNNTNRKDFKLSPKTVTSQMTQSAPLLLQMLFFAMCRSKTVCFIGVQSTLTQWAHTAVTATRLLRLSVQWLKRCGAFLKN